jgi:hypothetical protein
LIPSKSFCARFYILKFVPGNSGKDVTRAGFSRGTRGCNLAFRVHESAVANRGEHSWKRNLLPQNPSAQVANFHRDCLMWPEEDVFERAAILTQRNFAVRAAVQVIEHSSGNAPLSYAAKISNIQYARGRKFTHHSIYEIINEPTALAE